MAQGPTIYPTMRYRDARAAIDFLVAAFGFEAVMVVDGPDGTVAHAELAYGDGMVMLGSAGRDDSGLDLDRTVGNTSIYVVVDDADAHHARALENGAAEARALVDQDYGSREYSARDPEGNLWSFGTYRPSLDAQG